jgi:hypothetical protein
LLRDDFGSAKQQIDALAAQLHDSHFSARLGIIRAQLMQLAYEVEGAFTVMSLDRTHNMPLAFRKSRSRAPKKSPTRARSVERGALGQNK